MSLHVWNFNREPEVINLCLEIRGKSHAHLICQLQTKWQDFGVWLRARVRVCVCLEKAIFSLHPL